LCQSIWVDNVKKRVRNIDSLTKGGSYSHAVEAGGLIFVSGMLPLNPGKNLTITDDIRTATELALTNLKASVESVGSRLDKVVKITVFLRDGADVNCMNEVYNTFFDKEPPARSCVVVKEIPGGFPIEIVAIAIK
jgi:2-iminobutanoate/2-iminopropanoate deaminase